MTATSTYEYRYDENWQLTKCTETLQNGIITEYDYQYDKDGNRSKYVKTVNGEWTECYTYEYNAANQLVSRKNERLWTDNVTTYTYDADGNLLSEKTGLFEKTYEYTAENRLAVVKAQGTVLMAALYDGDGNRLFTMDYTGDTAELLTDWGYFLALLVVAIVCLGVFYYINSNVYEKCIYFCAKNTCVCARGLVEKCQII